MVARMRAAGAIIMAKPIRPNLVWAATRLIPFMGPRAMPMTPRVRRVDHRVGRRLAATGMMRYADGSDMMGSLRNPAGWNNVYGMRPTWVGALRTSWR